MCGMEVIIVEQWKRRVSVGDTALVEAHSTCALSSKLLVVYLFYNKKLYNEQDGCEVLPSSTGL